MDPIYSPPHANAHTSPTQWVLSDPALSFIGEGVEVTKYHRHRNARAKRRLFYHRGKIAWRQLKTAMPKCSEEVQGIPVDSIVDITEGKALNTFKHHTTKHANPNCCFSIHYTKKKANGRIQTYSADFETPDEETKLKWIDGLKIIVSRAKEDQQHLEQSDSLYVELKVDPLGGIRVIIWNREDKMAQDRREEMIRNVIAQTNRYASPMPRTPHSPTSQELESSTTPFSDASSIKLEFPHLTLSPSPTTDLSFEKDNAKEVRRLNELKNTIQSQSDEILKLKQMVAKVEIESAKKDVLLSQATNVNQLATFEVDDQREH